MRPATVRAGTLNRLKPVSALAVPKWSTQSNNQLSLRSLSSLLHCQQPTPQPVISLANRECYYTITLVINITTDSNDMHLVSWGSVCSVRPSITQHYWLIAIHKTYWIPSHLHEIVNTEHINTKQKLSFHDSKNRWRSRLYFLTCIHVRQNHRKNHPVPNVMCISAYRQIEKVSQNHGGWLHYNMKQIWR